MDFTPTARIDLSALRHNLNVARQMAPTSQVLAVIKANAYGHGAVLAAQALDQAHGFAVARVDEAVALREAGIDKPILVMGGAYNREAVLQAAERRLTLAIHHFWQLDLLRFQRLKQPIDAVIKVDTGMHRLGFSPEEVEEALQQLAALGLTGDRPKLMTHLANADDRLDPATQHQWTRFKALVDLFDAEYSVANSAGVMGWPELQGDWVRPGIMLYGASPFIDSVGIELGLRPVMTLEGRLIAVKSYPRGTRIGYGGTWECPETLPVGVVGIGYGDGYPRHARPGTPVLIEDSRVPLIGRVSMDMITLDLRTMPEAKVGDRVTLWGRGLPAETVAEACGTIAYEIFCGLADRVRREIIDDG
ncbi:MAG: alanine racemase [Gammaproteobacteria bacterium]|nr:alanine racemase [Gammaproteobacteria bacterium]MBU1653343.1 alanine racemase [Gammaproteobacteria bacterium]MBU1962771.1 alanine racemase [Gammaproteobacteria bacterium]